LSRPNILNTGTVDYLELIGNGKVFRVPLYQRDYSWSEEEWEDLWNDILELRNKPDDRHYMGALVVEGITDREFQIIDGQQRMATLSILSLAVIARLTKMSVAGAEPDANRERAGELRKRFIGEKDPASLVESSKLFLNEADNAFYQDYLVQLRAPLNPRGLPKSNRLLWECFRYFEGQIESLAIPPAEGEVLARLLSETISRQLLFIRITVEDELNAYTIFETLNARGLELTTTDLLKNYLFSRVKVAADREALQRRWKSLIATVGQQKFPDFLRYHMLCSHPKIRSPRLFKLVRDGVRTPEQVFALLLALEGRAELFAAMADPNHGYWTDLPEAKPFVRDLNLFRVSQMMPLLFAAWERFSKLDFARVLKLVSVISFRYTVVGGLNTNPLEPVYHKAAKAVLDGETATLAGVFHRLEDIYVNDAKFEQDFAQLVVDTGQRKKLAKFILCRFEQDASGRACDPDTDPATIEHVLPENPLDVWDADFPRKQWDAAVYRLGNLTLLESNLNRDVANSAYAEKLDAYGKSIYRVTRRITEMAPSQWTPELLEARQQALAQRAVHLWRSDFVETS
jgi:hypothetical protein